MLEVKLQFRVTCYKCGASEQFFDYRKVNDEGVVDFYPSNFPDGWAHDEYPVCIQKRLAAEKLRQEIAAHNRARNIRKLERKRSRGNLQG